MHKLRITYDAQWMVHSPVSLNWWHSLTTLTSWGIEIWNKIETLERCSCGEVGALHVGTEGKRTEIVSDPSQANPELGIYKPVCSVKQKGKGIICQTLDVQRGDNATFIRLSYESDLGISVAYLPPHGSWRAVLFEDFRDGTIFVGFRGRVSGERYVQYVGILDDHDVSFAPARESGGWVSLLVF